MPRLGIRLLESASNITQCFAKMIVVVLLTLIERLGALLYWLFIPSYALFVSPFISSFVPTLLYCLFAWLQVAIALSFHTSKGWSSHYVVFVLWQHKQPASIPRLSNCFFFGYGGARRSRWDHCSWLVSQTVSHG